MASKDDLSVRKYNLINVMRALCALSFCLGFFTIGVYAIITLSMLPSIGLLLLFLSMCLAVPEMNAHKRRLDAIKALNEAFPDASKAADIPQVAATRGKLIYALADFALTVALGAVLFFTSGDLSNLQCDLPTGKLAVPGKIMCDSRRVVWATYCTLPIGFALYATSSHLLNFRANYEIRLGHLTLLFSVHLIVVKQRIVGIFRCPDCKARAQELATDEEQVELVPQVESFDLEQQAGLPQEGDVNLLAPEK